MILSDSSSGIPLLQSALICALLFCLSACDRAGPGREGVEPELLALAEAFRLANAAEDVGPMLELYHLEASDAISVNMLKMALEFELGWPIASVHFEPLTGAPEESINFSYKGVHYGPSLEPGMRMRVVYAEEDQFTSLFSLGQTDAGQWRIVSVRPIN